jgi:plastocyanin
MRTVQIVAAALLLVGCAAPANEGAASPTAPPPAEAVEITVSDFMIEPADVTATGPTVLFEVTNDGPTPHNFTIRNDADEVVAATTDLSTGEAETLSVELGPGTYTIFCSLAGHESLGMSGTLVVSDA